MTPSEIAAIAISALSLVVSFIVLWRTEWRGPHVECLSVANSTRVNMGFERSNPHRFLINVWREILLVNDGHKPGYVGLIVTEMPAIPESTLDLTRSFAGIHEPGDHVPHEHLTVNKILEPRVPARFVASWWLEGHSDLSEQIREMVRDPDSALSLTLRLSVLEASLWRPKFKVRQKIVRPVEARGELIAWGEGNSPLYGL